MATENIYLKNIVPFINVKWSFPNSVRDDQ